VADDQTGIDQLKAFFFLPCFRVPAKLLWGFMGASLWLSEWFSPSASVLFGSQPRDYHKKLRDSW